MTLVPLPRTAADEQDAPAQLDELIEPGVADVVTLDYHRRGGQVTEEGFFADTLAEYRWARDAAGLAPSTLEQAIKPVIDICEFYGCAPWRLAPRHVDRFFATVGKRSHAYNRQRINRIDMYFAFLEQRYAGEIARRFGIRVESPVDGFNRPRHRGDFGLRVPPSQKAMRDMFSAWRASLAQARKYPVACRNYVMAKIAYISGVRAAELCDVRVGDVHWDHGQWGRFVVHGKGARGSGPRMREAYLFDEGRALLWWYVEEVLGLLADDPDDPLTPLWPSERIAAAAAALNVPVPRPAVIPETFRAMLLHHSGLYLTGQVHRLFPHLLRHACATHNYERGMTLWEVQRLLGHEWTTTTVRYLITAHSDPELAGPERVGLASATRAAQRLLVDAGGLR